MTYLDDVVAVGLRKVRRKPACDQGDKIFDAHMDLLFHSVMPALSATLEVDIAFASSCQRQFLSIDVSAMEPGPNGLGCEPNHDANDPATWTDQKSYRHNK